VSKCAPESGTETGNSTLVVVPWLSAGALVSINVHVSQKTCDYILYNIFKNKLVSDYNNFWHNQ